MQSINTTLLHWLCQNKYRIVQQNKVDPIWKVSIELQDTLRCHIRDFLIGIDCFFLVLCLHFPFYTFEPVTEAQTNDDGFQIDFQYYSILECAKCMNLLQKWWCQSLVCGLMQYMVYHSFIFIELLLLLYRFSAFTFAPLYNASMHLWVQKLVLRTFAKWQETSDNVSRMRKKTQILTNLTNLSTLRC